MIGANGSAERLPVLDVLSLLASSAQGKLSDAITDLSGLASVLTYDRAQSLQLDISMTVPNHQPLEYKLNLKPQGIAYFIDEETLSQRRTADHPQPFKRHVDSHGARREVLRIGHQEICTPELGTPSRSRNLPRAKFPGCSKSQKDFRNRLASSTFYHVLNVDPRSPVRLPQPMRPAMLPGRNGEELVSCLYYLRETERKRFEAVEDSLRAAFPRFDRLDFPPVAAGTIALAWRESGFSQPLYLHQLSEGTLRFLWLTTLLQSPGLTALTLLDEPEVSLHPDLLSLLADLLREASSRTQLIVATHIQIASFAFFQPKEIAVT